MSDKKRIENYIKNHPEVVDEFNSLLQDDPDFNYEDYELEEWVFDCCLDDELY